MSKLFKPLIIFTFVFLIAGMIAMNFSPPKMPILGKPVNAIRSATVTIGADDQGKLVEQLEKFANANAFATLKLQFRPDKRFFVYEMIRKDDKIDVLDPFYPNEFRIAFYANGNEPLTETSVDSLMNDLKSFVPKVRDNPHP